MLHSNHSTSTTTSSFSSSSSSYFLALVSHGGPSLSRPLDQDGHEEEVDPAEPQPEGPTTTTLTTTTTATWTVVHPQDVQAEALLLRMYDEPRSNYSHRKEEEPAVQGQRRLHHHWLYRRLFQRRTNDAPPATAQALYKRSDAATDPMMEEEEDTHDMHHHDMNHHDDNPKESALQRLPPDPEAAQVARWHWASSSSSLTPSSSSSSSSRNPMARRDDALATTPALELLSITGWGEVVEFRNNNNDDATINNGGGGGGIRQYTSDRDALVAYGRQRLTWQSQRLSHNNKMKNNNNMGGGGDVRSLFFDVRYTRSARIGRNTLLVSWGFGPGMDEKTDADEAENGHDHNGVVILYQRIAVPVSSTSTSTPVVTWLARACIGPSDAAMKVLTAGNININTRQHQGITPMNVASTLRRKRRRRSDVIVTDIVPLLYPIGTKDDYDTSDNDREEDTDDISSCTVAIARLGGVIEFVSLPRELWHGPPLQEVQVSPPSPWPLCLPHHNHNNRRRRSLFQRQHSQQPSQSHSSRLPDYPSHWLDLSSMTVIVTTLPFHCDIMCLEALALPPASLEPFSTATADDDESTHHQFHFLLAATGSRWVEEQQTEEDVCSRQVVSFWSVTLATTTTTIATAAAAACVTWMETIDLQPLGPDRTVFATPTLYQHWRNKVKAEHPQQKKRQRMTATISVPVPVTRMQFNICDHNHHHHQHHNRQGESSCRMAVLDWNGGLQILDCTPLYHKLILQQAATSCVTANGVHSEAPTKQVEDAPWVSIFRERSAISRLLMQYLQSSVTQERNGKNRFVRPPFISDMCWYSPRCFLNHSTGRLQPPFLAVVVEIPQALRALIVFSVTDDSIHQLKRPGESSPPSFWTMNLPSNTSSMVMVRVFGGRIAFMATTTRTKSSHLLDKYDYSLWSLEERDGVTLLQDAMKTDKLDMMIEIASQLSSVEQAQAIELVESVAKLHWHQTFDISVLDSIQDTKFVIHEALSMDAPKVGVIIEDAAKMINVFRQAHWLAIRRLNAEEGDPQLSFLQNRLLLLGTYQLICRILSVEATLTSFLTDFLSLSVADLAKSMALSCNLAGLSIVRFRHPGLVPSNDLLDLLPLSLDLSLYHHLLPTKSPEIFLALDGAHASIMKRLEFPSYARKRFGIEICVDEADAQLLELACSMPIVDPVTDVDDAISSAESWFMNRLRQMLRFPVGMDLAIAFTQCGIIALPPISNSSVSLHFERVLRRIKAFRAVQLNLTENQATSLDILLVMDHANIYEQEINVRNLIEAVFHVESANVESANLNQVDHIIKTALIPLLKDLATDASTDDIDSELSAFCKRLITSLSPLNSRASLNICASICHQSRCSLPCEKRLIKARRVLVETVESITSQILVACRFVHELSRLLESVWTMYECLPTSSVQVEYDTIGDIHDGTSADAIFEQLVLVELLSRWPEGATVAMEFSNVEYMARCTIQSISKSLSFQLKNHETPIGADDARKWLLVVDSDFRILNSLRYFASIDMNNLLSSIFTSELIKSMRLEVISVFMQSDFDWVDSTVVQSCLLSFIVEAEKHMEGDTLYYAVCCRNLLAKFFPQALVLTESSWRYLEAADFVQNVLLRDISSATRYRDSIRESYPLDVIDAILSEHPALVLHDCEQWAYPSIAESENHSIRTATELEHDRDVSVRESIQPGSAILHLAKLLDHDDGFQYVVQCLTISHCMSAGYFGAAAAVGRSLLSIIDGDVDIRIMVAAINAVNSVVMAEDYRDTATKQELCIRCFQLTPRLIESGIIQHNIGLIRSFISHDYFRFRDQESLQVFPAHNLLMIERLFAEYPALFYPLQLQCSDVRVDGRLLLELARNVLTWMISYLTTAKPFLLSGIEEAFLRDMACLGVSLLLHVPDVPSSIATLTEIEAILEKQVALGRRRVPQVDSNSRVKPSPQSIRKIQGRGYSEWGARRAIAMTDNNSVDDALRWAVEHSGDENFNEPMWILKPKNPLLIESAGIEQLKMCIHSARNILTVNASNCENGLSRAVQFHNGSPPTNCERSETTSDSFETSWSEAGSAPSHSSSPSPSCANTAKPLHSNVDNRPTAPSCVDMDSITSSNQDKIPSRIKSDMLSNDPLTNNGTAQSPSALECNKTSRNVANSGSQSHVDFQADERVSSDSNQSRISPATVPSIVPLSPGTRSKALRLGQAALNVARKRSSPNAEERKQLMEAGRKLLKSSTSSSPRQPHGSSAPSIPSSTSTALSLRSVLPSHNSTDPMLSTANTSAKGSSPTILASLEKAPESNTAIELPVKRKDLPPLPPLPPSSSLLKRDLGDPYILEQEEDNGWEFDESSVWEEEVNASASPSPSDSHIHHSLPSTTATAATATEAEMMDKDQGDWDFDDELLI